MPRGDMRAVGRAPCRARPSRVRMPALHAQVHAPGPLARAGRARSRARAQPKLKILTVNARFNIPDIYSPWAFFRTSSRDITCARGPAAVSYRDRPGIASPKDE